MTGGAQRRDDDDGPRWRKGEGVAFLWVIWKQVPSVGYSRLDNCCGGHNGKSIQSSLGVWWGERKKKKKRSLKRNLETCTLQQCKGLAGPPIATMALQLSQFQRKNISKALHDRVSSPQISISRRQAGKKVSRVS